MARLEEGPLWVEMRRSDVAGSPERRDSVVWRSSARSRRSLPPKPRHSANLFARTTDLYVRVSQPRLSTTTDATVPVGRIGVATTGRIVLLAYSVAETAAPCGEVSLSGVAISAVVS